LLRPAADANRNRWRGQNTNGEPNRAKAVVTRCDSQPLEGPERRCRRCHLCSRCLQWGLKNAIATAIFTSPRRWRWGWGCLWVQIFFFFSPFHCAIMNCGIVLSVMKEGYRFVLIDLVLLLLLVCIWCYYLFCKLILILYHSLADLLAWTKHCVRVVILLLHRRRR